MLFCGGTNISTCIHIFTVWPWTICRSQVRFLILKLVLLLNTILATSVHVERVFSQGRILLSHIHSCLSVQSMRALMCLGVWSLMGYVMDSDIVKLGFTRVDFPNPGAESDQYIGTKLCT